jgi:formamidopyrimidine-DNA glycosylase
MPELPEVETIRRGLEKRLIGQEITDIQILNPKSFHGDPSEIRGKIVLKIWRRAKVLGIDLDDQLSVLGLSATEKLKTGKPNSENRQQRTDNRLTLLFHLKMSGQLIWVGEKKDKVIGGHPTKDWTGEMPNKSTRVIFEFGEVGKLFFNDQRKFGWVKVGRRAEDGGWGLEFLDKLGPEPLEKEFTWEILKQRVGRHRGIPIKVAILDQQAVAGVENAFYGPN